MFNISINGDIYDCYTFGLEEKVFEAIIILNNNSMNDIIASVKKGNADIVVKEGTKEVGRYVNYTSLLSAEYKIDFNYDEGISDAVELRTNNPSLLERMDNIEVLLSDAETSVVNLQDSVEVINGDVEVAKQDISAAQNNIQSAQANIATINTSINTINGSIDSINGDVSTAQSDIGILQTNLSAAEDAIDYLIMKDTPNEEVV